MKLSSLFAAGSFAFIASAAFAVPTGSVMSVNGTELNSTADSAAVREFVVSVNLADFAGAVGAQATVAYDSTKVEYVGIVAGDDFPTLIYSQHNAGTKKITFATGVDANASSSGIAAGNIAKLTFRTVSAACSVTNAVTLSTSTVPSRVTDANGVSLTYTDANNVSITSLAPFTLSGVPSGRTVAADAGTTAGSLQSFTSPTAQDSCGTALTVNFSRDDSASSSAYYPVGTTTITWSATDAAGNSDSGTTTVTVSNYQLLDASFALNGSITGTSTRSVRVKAGSSTQLVNFAMTNGSGSTSDIQVPVAASYGCMSAKDASHSLTSTGTPSVSGVKYSASFSVDQGDSNDDDLVDILDFGIYVGDFGAASAGGVSNFNDDSAVNSGDYGFIALNFFHTGTGCGSFTGGTPKSAVSVKELRRAGLGNLAGADLNRDGMLDTADIAYYMQNGIPARRVESPTVAPTAW